MQLGKKFGTITHRPSVLWLWCWCENQLSRCQLVSVTMMYDEPARYLSCRYDYGFHCHLLAKRHNISRDTQMRSTPRPQFLYTSLLFKYSTCISEKMGHISEFRYPRRWTRYNGVLYEVLTITSSLLLLPVFLPHIGLKAQAMDVV